MTGFNSKRQASKSLAANPWRDAIDAELICCHIGTVESFPTAKYALNELINWYVKVALDPEVSSAAKALVDRGAAVAEPLTDEQIVRCADESDIRTELWDMGAGSLVYSEYCSGIPRGDFTNFVRRIEAAHGIGIKGAK